MSELRLRRSKAFQSVDLYPVTSEEFSAGRNTIEIVKAVVKAGCKIVQLREKSLTKRAYFEMALKVRDIASDLLMICNDHLDVALAVGADGVHLGTDDLPLAAARRLAPDLLIGASTHSLDEAIAAQEAGADYVNIGPIFPTATKERAAKYLGPGAICAIAPHLKAPFTVMGGIKLENISQLLDAGARRIAVVTAITAAPDPQEAALSLRCLILERK